jgi:hypothetical protein
VNSGTSWAAGAATAAAARARRGPGTAMSGAGCARGRNSPVTPALLTPFHTSPVMVTWRAICRNVRTDPLETNALVGSSCAGMRYPPAASGDCLKESRA